MKKYYITTAIAYPNGPPHLGHTLEIIQADASTRFQKLLGKDVFFQTGTDEYGTKNWTTAKEKKKEIMVFLNENVKVFKDLYKLLNVNYDNFLRTTDKKNHFPGAQKLWNELVKSGDIYKKQYKGLYCSGCESFKTERELNNGKCPNHPTREIQTIEEENYFFKLSKYKDQVINLIETDKYKIIPEIRKNEILSFLKTAKDISFSRLKTSLQWGIPVPGDKEHVMYVWCDALANYISGIGYGREENKFKKIWPADVHIIGKDILRFHAAFWPAMLLSANLKLPKQLFVHGFVLSEGEKMSKSEGTRVDPFEQIKTYGTDPFRFYLLGAIPHGNDGDYSETIVKERINTELVGNLSNFCYRVLSFTAKNHNSKIKDLDKDPVINKIIAKFKTIKQAYEEYDYKKAVDNILAVSALGNQYFQKKEPWKNDNQEVLATCINIAKNLSILIQPIIPETANKLQKQLNLTNLTWKDLNFNLKNHKIGKPEILIKKIQ